MYECSKLYNVMTQRMYITVPTLIYFDVIDPSLHRSQLFNLIYTPCSYYVVISYCIWIKCFSHCLRVSFLFWEMLFQKLQLLYQCSFNVIWKQMDTSLPWRLTHCLTPDDMTLLNHKFIIISIANTFNGAIIQ